MIAKRNVTVLPATLAKFTSAPMAKNEKRKVAGYARVSTDHDDQFTSYQAQIDYYTNFIQNHEYWKFVDVYTDEGITGTSTKHREGFKRMVSDALAGKIDLIVTKSVSRFARNTVDSLTTIRKLKEKGIEVYFEKENIWTFDGKGELLLTIMSSLAQEESRSISENCTWGQRKRFADGKVTVAFSRFLGYDRAPDGNLVVNKKQAGIVRRIYALFLEGKTYGGIATILTADRIKTPGGINKWSSKTIKSILSNEKYKGDALLQKSFTVDYLTKQTKVNDGEIPQYYVERNHDAIIDPEIFDMVQREIEKISGSTCRKRVHYLSGKIKCGQCDGWYGSKIWHSNSKYRKVIWRCNHKYSGEKHCHTPHVTDEELILAFQSAIGKILAFKEEVLARCQEMITMLFSTAELEAERDTLMKETSIVSEMAKLMIGENTRTVLDQTVYQEKYEMLVRRYDTAKSRLDVVVAEIKQKQSQQADLESFAKAFEETSDGFAGFTAQKWMRLVDFVTVYASDDIRITFRNGQEIKA